MIISDLIISFIGAHRRVHRGKFKIQGVIDKSFKIKVSIHQHSLYMCYMWYMCLCAKSDKCVYVSDLVIICIWLKSLDIYDDVSTWMYNMNDIQKYMYICVICIDMHYQKWYVKI